MDHYNNIRLLPTPEIMLAIGNYVNVSTIWNVIIIIIVIIATLWLHLVLSLIVFTALRFLQLIENSPTFVRFSVYRYCYISLLSSCSALVFIGASKTRFTVPQFSYQVSQHRTALRACQVLWDHFVESPSCQPGHTSSSLKQFDSILTLPR